MKIKVCGMTEAKNISAISNLDIDMLGFIFYNRSPRCINIDSAKDVMQDIPGHIQKTGVFVDAALEDVVNHATKLSLDFAQLHGHESVSYVSKLTDAGVEVIKVFHVDDDFEWTLPMAYEGRCTYFLFDTASSKMGGTGRMFDWSLLAQYTGKTAFILSGGINPTTILPAHLLADERCLGVDINSRFESSPGIKNVEHVNTFVHRIKSK